MRRATSLLLTYGALVVPALFAGAGLIQAAPRPAGSTIELQVTGQAGVPADASAVVLNITSAGARGTGYITAWPCGTVRPNASNLNYGVGAPVANSAIVRIGSGGKVCLFTADSDTELIVDINGWFPAGSDYAPTSPARLLDTRPGLTTVDAVAAGQGLRRAGGTYELQVTGRAGVLPNASAVVLNLTSAEARGVGFMTAWPCGAPRPNASNLNYGVGAPVASNAIVKVGTGGKVCLLTADTDTQVIADVNGWFPASSDYVSASPARLLDTRPGLTTVDGLNAGQGLRRAGGTYELQVTGRAGVPSSASAVVLNLTSAEARGVGFLTAWPCGTPRPVASNLNYGVGAPVANTAIVKVGTGGKVCLFTGDTDTELIADINGWFPGGSDYSAITPQRLLDTRDVTWGTQFAETFSDGEGWHARWDTDVHHRADRAGGQIDTALLWRADHDMTCGGADTIRLINAGGDRSQHFWVCGPPGVGNAHVMTSMGDVDGYSTLSMAPKQAFPVVHRVCWDQNVTDQGGRQWTEVLVVPASKIADGDLTHVNPEFVGVDEWTKQHDASTWGIMVHGQYFGLNVFANGVRQVDSTYQLGRDKAGQESRSIRRQHCITDNGNGSVTVVIDQGVDGFYQRTFSGRFPTNARVILEQHAYTPSKDGEDCETIGILIGCRTTWHWDNVTVQ
jgi:hypothetical protein